MPKVANITGGPDKARTAANAGAKSIFMSDKAILALLPLYLWTFVHIGRPQDIFPFLFKLHLGKVFAGLTIFAYFATLKKTNQEILIMPEVKLFIALVLLMILSGSFGVYPRLSFNFLTGDFYKSIIYFLILVKVLTTIKDVERLAWTTVISATAMALASVSTGQAGAGRVSIGTMYDPNDFAMMLVTSLPFVLFFFLRTKGLIKVFSSASIILILLAIILTQSRGGFIGLGVVITAFLFSQSYEKQVFRKIALVMLLCFLFCGLASENYWDRIQTIWTGDDQGSGRVILYKRSLKLMLENPILGTGVGCFVSAYGRALENKQFHPVGSEYDWKWKTAHNAFLQIGVELGFPGLVIYLILIYYTIRNFSETKRLSKIKGLKDVHTYANMFKVSLMGFLVCSFFLSKAYSASFFLILAVSTVLRRIAQEK